MLLYTNSSVHAHTYSISSIHCILYRLLFCAVEPIKSLIELARIFSFYCKNITERKKFVIVSTLITLKTFNTSSSIEKNHILPRLFTAKLTSAGRMNEGGNVYRLHFANFSPSTLEGENIHQHQAQTARRRRRPRPRHRAAAAVFTFYGPGREN